MRRDIDTLHVYPATAHIELDWDDYMHQAPNGTRTLLYIDIADNNVPDAPLRLTREEWDDMLDVNWWCGKLFTFPQFTLLHTVEMSPWDFAEVLEVALPYRRGKRFGPHRSNTLARLKAQRYLIANGALRMVDDVADATATDAEVPA